MHGLTSVGTRVGGLLVLGGVLAGGCGKGVTAPVTVPAMRPEHRHAGLLVANAFRYTDPAHGRTDAASGHPVEGWTQSPKRGLHLRSFTQLTAIGQWIELLACIAAGQAPNPYRTPDQALGDLERVLEGLRADQADPNLGAMGLLSNFLGFEGERRVGPLATNVQRDDFLEVFGSELGTEVWYALVQHEWLKPEKDGTQAIVRRSAEYGSEFFEGGLKPYAEQGLDDEIMELLDARVVQIIFGDNVNLTASVAKGIGALLHSSIRDNPRAVALRESMEQFIADQADGYAKLYDNEESSFAFGWNATEDRFFGWELDDGRWNVGRMNYLVNEFRGGWMFVVLRFGFPRAAILSADAQLRTYTLRDGRAITVPIAWDGSAFQMLGLSRFMQEMQNLTWSAWLSNAVEAELDYAYRHGLPGFLSESYSGNDTEYTGAMGIPELAVTEEPRITDAPSLYTLGVAYQIAPDAVNAFLAANWSTIGQLLTNHGPWEGYKTTSNTPIRFQTTAHTLSLILGFVGTADANMARYLTTHGMMDDVHALNSSLARSIVSP